MSPLKSDLRLSVERKLSKVFTELKPSENSDDMNRNENKCSSKYHGIIKKKRRYSLKESTYFTCKVCKNNSKRKLKQAGKSKHGKKQKLTTSTREKVKNSQKNVSSDDNEESNPSKSEDSKCQDLCCTSTYVIATPTSSPDEHANNNTIKKMKHADEPTETQRRVTFKDLLKNNSSSDGEVKKRKHKKNKKLGLTPCYDNNKPGTSGTTPRRSESPKNNSSRSNSSRSITPAGDSPRCYSPRNDDSPKSAYSRSPSPRNVSPRSVTPANYSPRSVSSANFSPRSAHPRYNSPRSASSREGTPRTASPRSASSRSTSPRSGSDRASPDGEKDEKDKSENSPSFCIEKLRNLIETGDSSSRTHEY